MKIKTVIPVLIQLCISLINIHCLPTTTFRPSLTLLTIAGNKSTEKPKNELTTLSSVTKSNNKSFINKLWDLLPSASHHPHDKHHHEHHASKDHDSAHHWGHWKG